MRQEKLTLVAGVSYVESGGSVGTITFTLRLQKQALHTSNWQDETLTWTEIDETQGSVTKSGYVEITTTGDNVTKTLNGYSSGLQIRRWVVVGINYNSINTANISSETDNNLN